MVNPYGPAARKMTIARMLMANANQPIQNPFNAISNLANTYMGLTMAKRAEADRKADQLNKAETIRQAIRARRGFTNPDDTYTKLAGPMVEGLPISQQPGARVMRAPKGPMVPGSRQAMADVLMGSGRPDLMTMGAKLDPAFNPPKPVSVAPGAALVQNGKVVYQNPKQDDLYTKGNIRLSALREARVFSRKIQNGDKLSPSDLREYQQSLRILSEPDTIKGFDARSGQETITTRPGIPSSYFAPVPTSSPRSNETLQPPVNVESTGGASDEVTSEEVTVAKPIQMPPAAIESQNQDVADVNLSLDIRDSMEDVVAQIDGNEIDFGLFSNFYSKGRNVLGMSTEQSRNFSSFKNRLEKLRNDSLRLNKGIQTEGDAQRALNELFENLNDKNLVRQRLKEISDINKKAAAIRRRGIKLRRQEFKLPDLDDAYFTEGRRTKEERTALRLARNAVSRGASVQSVIQKAKEEYGITLTEEDF